MFKYFKAITLAIIFFCFSACEGRKHNIKEHVGNHKSCDAPPSENSTQKPSYYNALKDAIRNDKILRKSNLVLNELYDALKSELSQKDFLTLKKNRQMWIYSMLDDLNSSQQEIDTENMQTRYLTEIQRAFTGNINELLEEYQSSIKSGLLKKLSAYPKEAALSTSLKYAVSWLIFHDFIYPTLGGGTCYESYALRLGKNLTVSLIAPALWLWAANFETHYSTTNRHGGVIRFFLVDVSQNTIAPIKIICPEKFKKLAFYDGAEAIEATYVSDIQKNNICIDIEDYRRKKVPEEKIWLTCDLDKKVMEITKHEDYGLTFND